MFKQLGGCGCLIFIFNLLVGGLSVQYCLMEWFHKAIPFWADVFIGLFAAEITFPGAIITWILKCVGVI